MDTYAAVRSNSAAVLRCLARYSVDEKTYYAVRSRRSTAPFKRAAQFIYLNKVGWNGLYRVNSRGEFNVPFGAPKTDVLVDSGNLKACGEALSLPKVRLSTADFQDSLKSVKPGDLVFLDPPYVTRHNNNGFVDYNERLFSWRDQERLATEAARMMELGAFVIVSNANHADVLHLFPDFELVVAGRPSTLAGSMASRGRVSEAILIGRGAIQS